MKRVTLVLGLVAVMAATIVVLTAPAQAQDLDDDCVSFGGDTFCNVEEVSAVYDFGDCFSTDGDFFCRVVRFDSVAGDVGLFRFDDVDVDRELEDVNLDDELDLDGLRLGDLDEDDLVGSIDGVSQSFESDSGDLELTQNVGRPGTIGGSLSGGNSVGFSSGGSGGGDISLGGNGGSRG